MNKTGIWDLEEASCQHAFDNSLANALLGILKNEKIIDIGCGKGDYLNLFYKNGLSCIGYEGTPNIKEISSYQDIRQADLSKEINLERGCVLCLEVAEHIPKEYEDVFIRNIVGASTGSIIISWAVVGQGGHGHVNEQNSEYVISKFAEHGFLYNEDTSNILREKSSLWWFKKSIYVFDKIEKMNIQKQKWLGQKPNRQTMWAGLESYIPSIIKEFNINPKKALEFGVEYGYSLHIFAQLFSEAYGVDTFDGDEHAGVQEKNIFKQVADSFKNTNVSIFKSDFRDFIECHNSRYDLIHIDIIHTYKETFECLEWSIFHSDVVILHDTCSFPEINRVCEDMVKKYPNYGYYNIPEHFGLGIIYRKNV